MPPKPVTPLTLTRMLRRLTESLADGTISTSTWSHAYLDTLAQYHLAAYAHGADLTLKQLTPEDYKLVDEVMQRQRKYFDGYIKAWQDGTYAQSAAAAVARDALYAEATKGTWWMGATRGWPLPAWPGDGTTQCKTHCKCTWDIQVLDGEGNADAYWRLSPAEHCQTCHERADDWAPLQIRGGELLI